MSASFLTALMSDWGQAIAEHDQLVQLGLVEDVHHFSSSGDSFASRPYLGIDRAVFQLGLNLVVGIQVAGPGL